ncbi:hypothetical protein DEA8626_00575 [Defluviimonas aquaemixtae]|uniref:Uncharacterized protein n=1 Tax=Albidovulum aquaemixtae TaxID=1542388 RepID=A0A2R8B328_9RHOB|nr:hypothetical protein [Defluviimonas aquaemixtae]SPH17061.1 hypothetical protein DEA8626_00575 [Defluviimonas aquaemixtae]
MTVSNELIERLSTETGRRLSERARNGRRRALSRHAHFCVTITVDGQNTHDVYFEDTPTLGDIFDRIGPGVYIVAVTMKRRPLRERLRLALAAE